jgi:serine protease Do
MYNDNERINSGYPYSPQPESGAPQPEQTPIPWEEPRKHGRGKAKKVVAGVLCGALLIGGGFGAGWMVKDWGKTETEVMVSSRKPVEVQTVAVTGSERLSFPEIYKANIDSCVSINTSTLAGYNFFNQPVEVPSAGSGFILTADGYIATNCHVVNNATSVQVTLNDGTTYDAQVVGSDADYDIAVLKVDPGETKLKPVVVGTSSKMNVGDDVCTIGNPLGELTFSMSEGIVSCIDREINLEGTPFNMIQITSAINPGNSGGPLFNAYGEVVGIVTAKTSQSSNGTSAEGLGFAIPIDDVMAMLKDIMENGQVTSHAYMAVTVSDAARYPQSGMSSGAYLVEVTEGGPADKAGLQAGDVITMLGTTPITSQQDVKSALGSKTYKAGDTATVTYVREGQVYTTDLTFGSTTEKPADPEPQASIQQPQQGQQDRSYDDYYGDMEDFFNQFFGRYGRAS